MKRALRAVAIVGMSSVAVVLFGAIRLKFVALGVGAEGVGSLGILTATANFGVVLFGLGLNTSGIQAVAAVTTDPIALQRTRSALLRGAGGLALVGGLFMVGGNLVWGLLQPTEGPGVVLSIALAVTLISLLIMGAQVALLNGLGRLKALAICNSIGAAVGTVITIVALQISDTAGIVAALVAAPMASAACSTWFVARIAGPKQKVTRREWWPAFQGMASLGGMVMLGLIATNAVQLGIRVWIEGTYGLAVAGHYQSAWTITSLYIGFVLTALAAEFFPRISAAADNREHLNKSVDAQVRLALLLAWPVLMWTIVLAEFVLHVLYSAEFSVASGLLRWQLVGDVLKVVGWGIAFLLLARKAKISFFVGEIAFNATYLGAVLAIPGTKDLVGVGLAYICAYAIYVLVVLMLAWKESRFRMSILTSAIVVVFLVLAAGAALGMQSGSTVGLVAALAIAGTGTLGSLALLLRMRKVERLDEESVQAAAPHQESA